MKYWWGYLIAAIFAGFSWCIAQLGEKYGLIVDMVYPYVTRTVQTVLSSWTGTVDVLVWQVAVVVFVLIALTILVLLFVFKGNVIRYVGWLLAVVSIVCFLHTGIYGLNYYVGPLTDDLRMTMEDYTQSDLELALTYYRDRANELSVKLDRDENGDLIYPEFEYLSGIAGDGYRTLTLERSFSVFGGDLSPVKKLGWADMYTSMGITGFTCFLTGEAAVNPQIPVVDLPYTMCHEMAHRMCVAQEDEANFAAFLACEANDSIYFRYSAYYKAFRYCYNALYAVDSDAAAGIRKDCTDELLHDLDSYNRFFADNKDEKATELAETVNDTYLKTSGDEDGIRSYGKVCDQLVNWYLTEYAAPAEEEEAQFDPYDETQVDLTGLVNARTENG